MINESINYNIRKRPGELGNGLPIKIENGKYAICQLNECTHIQCRQCAAIFKKEQWLVGYECQSCGR